MMRRIFATLSIFMLLFAVALPASAATASVSLVILVSNNESDYAVALDMASATGAQVIVTDWGQYEQDVLAEILAMSPQEVIIIGGPKAVPQEYEDQLKAAGIKVERLWGDTRIGTAYSAIEWLASNGYLDGKDIIYVNAWDPAEIIQVLSMNQGAVIVPVDEKHVEKFQYMIEAHHPKTIYAAGKFDFKFAKKLEFKEQEAFMNAYEKIMENATNSMVQSYASMAYQYYKEGDYKKAFMELAKAYKYMIKEESMEKVREEVGIQSASIYIVDSMNIQKYMYVNGAPVNTWVWYGDFTQSPYVMTFENGYVTDYITFKHQPYFVVVNPPASDTPAVGRIMGIDGDFTFSGGLSSSENTIYIYRLVSWDTYTVKWTGTLVIEPYTEESTTSTMSMSTTKTSTMSGTKTSGTLTQGDYEFTKAYMGYVIKDPSGQVYGEAKMTFVESGSGAIEYYYTTNYVTKTSMTTTYTLAEVPYFSVATIISEANGTYTVVGHPIGMQENMTWTVVYKDGKLSAWAKETYSIGPYLAYYTFEGEA